LDNTNWAPDHFVKGNKETRKLEITKLTFCKSEHAYNHALEKNGSTVLPLFSEILDVLDIISRTSWSDLLVCLFPILPIFNTVVIYCYLLVKYAGEL
jgi:hypothetical protein